MPLSWNEIRSRALTFSKTWASESSESAEAKSFWDAFFDIFGISRRRIASFEKHINKIDGQDGFIDLLWKGVLLVEHKSRGKNLDHAHKQALDYFHGLEEAELPRYVLISDFARFRLYDLDEGTQHEFPLEDLHKNINRFAFIAGYQTHKIKDQDPVNIQAAELMGKLHDRLQAIGYAGHDLEVYLVRLLFCLFAEDTGIFEREQFQGYIEDRTGGDGADLAPHLHTLFDVLNTPVVERLRNLDEQLNDFPFVNGKLFEERLRPAAFDSAMRESLLQCCALDWSRISPAIFGSLFQSIMDKDARHNLGAHYTSEKNILKLINPLFMDDLRAEFEKVKKNKNKLFAFHKKLRTLNFLDPACGCGNFLVIAYRELRLLELEILRVSTKGTQTFDVHTLIALDVDQFYGIEIEEFPVQISQVAMWLVDHQMNVLVSEEFGMYFARIPLVTSANIVHGNALRMDWRDVVAPEQISYIMGNPPFIGHHLQSAKQKAEMLSCYTNPKIAGVMDFVTAWYCKAVNFIKNTDITVAFVSTNSIAQGEQVGILWRELESKTKLHIHFAHRTFKWSNEAKGVAAVYCVIIGFADHAPKKCRVFNYETITGEPQEYKASQINAYLVDAPWVLFPNRTSNPFGMPNMIYGSKPTDGGNFLFTDKEKKAFLQKEPAAREFIKPFISAREYLHGEKRWVLWLVDADPKKLHNLTMVRKRIDAVNQFRKASKAASTRDYPYPTLFRQVTQPDSNYLLVPRTTSENRQYIPFGFFNKDNIVGDTCLSLPDATLFHFGVMSSSMHMEWVRYTCGRLKSDYRYSKDVVYNNFPWPKNPTAKQTADIETKAQAVLDARAKFPDSTLADLYDPLTMPPTLQKTHQALDKAVDRTYRKAAFNNEASRVAWLFDLYQQYTAPLLPQKKKRQRRQS